MVRWFTWLRWLLVLPAAWVAWYAAVLIGFGLYTVAEALCPPDQVISGMCVAPWFGTIRLTTCGRRPAPERYAGAAARTSAK
jgi:hypothetical protein